MDELNEGAERFEFLRVEIFLFFQEALNWRTQSMPKTCCMAVHTRPRKATSLIFFIALVRCLMGGAGLHISFSSTAHFPSEATRKPPYRQGNGSELGVLQTPYTQLASPQGCGWAPTEYSLHG